MLAGHECIARPAKGSTCAALWRFVHRTAPASAAQLEQRRTRAEEGDEHRDHADARAKDDGARHRADQAVQRRRVDLQAARARTPAAVCTEAHIAHTRQAHVKGEGEARSARLRRARDEDAPEAEEAPGVGLEADKPVDDDRPKGHLRAGPRGPPDLPPMQGTTLRTTHGSSARAEVTAAGREMARLSLPATYLDQGDGKLDESKGDGVGPACNHGTPWHARAVSRLCWGEPQLGGIANAAWLFARSRSRNSACRQSLTSAHHATLEAATAPLCSRASSNLVANRRDGTHLGRRAQTSACRRPAGASWSQRSRRGPRTAYMQGYMRPGAVSELLRCDVRSDLATNGRTTHRHASRQVAQQQGGRQRRQQSHHSKGRLNRPRREIMLYDPPWSANSRRQMMPYAHCCSASTPQGRCHSRQGRCTPEEDLRAHAHGCQGVCSVALRSRPAADGHTSAQANKQPNCSRRLRAEEATAAHRHAGTRGTTLRSADAHRAEGIGRRGDAVVRYDGAAEEECREHERENEHLRVPARGGGHSCRAVQPSRTRRTSPTRDEESGRIVSTINC